MLFWYSSNLHSYLLHKPVPIAQTEYIPSLEERIHVIRSTSPRENSHNPPKTNCNTGMRGTTHNTGPISPPDVWLQTTTFLIGNSWRHGIKLDRYE